MNQWLVKARGETIVLIIYEYGTAVPTQQHLEEFVAMCIGPENTDRAGAIAEQSLRDVVEKLQQQWLPTFQAEAVVWRMWATHRTRNSSRITWDEAILQPPPMYIICSDQPTIVVTSKSWPLIHQRTQHLIMRTVQYRTVVV
ncbi:hypothetical protein H310_09345 [Aphanomyces invadans]|uniref:Uncharacterized protein n=1 Tax=Aphanomyces invadans TaxID=157072 RepID=A0A024TV52_9STRA|nr:hypothetical protein H310_09345 [Aphanomyces invadans]ETV98055.1 hypothetical protein H310_09345 [Aphanomyces invadans]|eukprot:XP_008873616.1 hypothetical protein H310_09345 [Aphanomyces invadans]